MKSIFSFLLFFPLACSNSTPDPAISHYEEQAARVTIIRDQFGVPHIYGKTDADAVFGLMYAQCEESFERVERNYIEKMGRMAEIEGESHLYSDLVMRLLYDTNQVKQEYTESPPWLKKLLDAFADGINYYLYKHPDTKPLLIKKFEPWFPLLFTDGAFIPLQTGGLGVEDIRNLYALENAPTSFYVDPFMKKESLGSNGFAIAPSRSATGNALLYINPHVSFYFRTEAHMVSEEGLNAYGAVTWGQFFVFQGFNENCGWMHTSSQADATDLYEHTIVRRGDSISYIYEKGLKPVLQKQVLLAYNKNNSISTKKITQYYTTQGPFVGSRKGRWLKLKENSRSLNGLIQSWQRTKAKNIDEFKEFLALRANASTNTLYADGQGNIAYWHGNFIPKRSKGFDWSGPVDGSLASTEWQGAHALEEIVQVQNPAQGWIQNCNSSPFHVSGMHTIDAKKYPAYMAPEGENFRSQFAIRELAKEKSYTSDKLIGLGYNNYLSLFDTLLPPLLKAYDGLPMSSPYKDSLAAPVKMLRDWDRRSTATSVATTLAIEWAYFMMNAYRQEAKVDSDEDQLTYFTRMAREVPGSKQLSLLKEVINGLVRGYGNWKIGWGEINRYQRTSGDYYPGFDDNKPSLPVGMASALFGSLPAFEASWNKTRKGYGVAGNSFVAVVEFGKRVKAKSIVTGGQFFDPSSPHFVDQAAMFVEGKFKEVLFYKEDVQKQAERTYHPGE